ncbi:succinylglutamate desuccinylase/aspartoacylase family protein [Flavobacterium sp. YJ01]|nr:succinylglutamate desuccinylase/aspartoacylase family protein [Flavobacterium sp. YJ01]WET03405.1 succinylglutamate desuccinylase/aspartoacylase family protein [Flavobacterium sp. YJ01]
MKHLFLFLLSFFICQTAESQKKSLKMILDEKQAAITDTIFCVSAADSSRAYIPATLISGRRKGPTFTIAAGIYGMGYPAIASLLQLRREIDPEKLSGCLIIIPIMNLESFYNRTPLANPADHLNLDLAFPGSPAGTITEVTADFITTGIFDATDIFLDIHGGGVNENLVPHACYYDNKELQHQTQLAARLSEISGLAAVVSLPYNQPSGHPARQAFKQAVRLGIPALSITVGKLGSYEKTDIVSAKNAVYRMMQELNMYDNKKVLTASPLKRSYTEQVSVTGPGRGLFYSSFKAGAIVTKDEEIGYITDVFGRNIKIITAPVSGTILKKNTGLAVNEGETLFYIGSGQK